MSDSEREQMKHTLSTYADLNPVEEGIPTYSEVAPVQIWFARFIESKKAAYVTVPLVTILFLGGGLSAAAHDALPGDTLYSVKVGFNEEVRGVLAFTDEAEAKWNAERAERRLEEAEVLAIRGELDAEKRTQLEEKFQEHAARVEEHSTALATRGHFEVAAERQSDLEARLTAHAEVLEVIHEGERDGVEVENFLGTVRAQVVSASHARVSFEAEEEDEHPSRAREALRNAQEVQIIARQSSALGLDVALTATGAVGASADTATSTPEDENASSTLESDVDNESDHESSQGEVQGVERGKNQGNNAEKEASEENMEQSDMHDAEINFNVDAEPRLGLTHGSVLY